MEWRRCDKVEPPKGEREFLLAWRSFTGATFHYTVVEWDDKHKNWWGEGGECTFALEGNKHYWWAEIVGPDADQ